LKAHRVLGPGEEQDAAFGKLYPDQPVPATGQESRGNQNRATSSFDHRHIATSNASNRDNGDDNVFWGQGSSHRITPASTSLLRAVITRPIVAVARTRWGRSTREALRRIECTRRAGRAGGAGRR